MKKFMLVLSVAGLSGLFLSSCKKDYTCVCTLNGDEVWRDNLGKQSRSDARDACEAKTVTFGIVAKCELE